MRIKNPVCPECGQLVCGTQETIPGRANLLREEDGSFQYDGETVVDWDGQRTIVDERGRVRGVCPDWHEWWLEVEVESPT